MSMLETGLLIIHLLVAAAICGFVLLQHGKGADMGAAFGSGASGSLFGASGSANFLSRATAVLATLFFVCTLLLAYFGNLRAPASDSGSVLERSAPATAPSPAAPASGAAQIPGTGAPVPAPAPAAPAPAASGAAQIPAR